MSRYVTLTAIAEDGASATEAWTRFSALGDALAEAFPDGRLSVHLSSGHADDEGDGPRCEGCDCEECER